MGGYSQSQSVSLVARLENLFNIMERRYREEVWSRVLPEAPPSNLLQPRSCNPLPLESTCVNLKDFYPTVQCLPPTLCDSRSCIEVQVALTFAAKSDRFGSVKQMVETCRARLVLPS